MKIKKNNVATEYLVLGLMSGTSLDGLDMAFCRFWQEEEQWHYQLISSTTTPYSSALKDRLARGMDCSALELKKLDIDLAHFFASQVNIFLKDSSLKPAYIASHGHTIFHRPKEGITLQIGSGATIAAKTGITTISDFRSLDVALGGEGAPLVPVGDALLFPQYTACLNLGGFSNISFENKSRREAFDISPCNLPLNLLAKKCGMEFDRDGALAKEGMILNELLAELNALPYYHQKGPKSLGYEWLKEQFLPIVHRGENQTQDQLRTIVEHVGVQIAKIINSLEGETVLTTGGGARNLFLIERIKKNTVKKIVIPEDETVEYKEAIVFALLGLLRVLGEINTLASVTGASKDSCGGTIYYGSKR